MPALATAATLAAPVIAKTIGASAIPLAAKMAAASAAGSAINAIPSFIPTETQRANKKRLKELERLEEMGMLGLTDREETMLRNRLTGGAEQAQRRADAEMRRLAANTAQPQLQMQQAQLAAQNKQDLEARIAQEILQLDLQRQAQQEQELKDVRAAVDQKRQDMVAAGLSPVSSGLEGYIQGLTIQQMFGTNMTPQERTTALSQQTGLPPDEIAKTFPIVHDGLFPQGGTMPVMQSQNAQDFQFQPSLVERQNLMGQPLVQPGLSYEQFLRAQQGMPPFRMTNEDMYMLRSGQINRPQAAFDVLAQR